MIVALDQGVIEKVFEWLASDSQALAQTWKCSINLSGLTMSDGLIAAAEAGAKAAIQPGGSVRDDEVIAAADEHGMAMVFTGMRHFRH